MPIAIEMPKLSDTMTEGTLVKWIKKVGDTVAVGDVLAEVETDKATMEMEAFDEGILSEIYVKDGEKVEIDTFRFDLAGIERRHTVIEAAGERHRNFGHATSPARRISGLPMRLVTG